MQYHHSTQQDERAKIDLKPIRPETEGDVRRFGLYRLQKAANAFEYHLWPERRRIDRLSDPGYLNVAGALRDISAETNSNMTRLGDELCELAEAVHSLRNAYVRRAASFGSKRFAVITEVVDCLFFVSPEDDDAIKLLTYIVIEVLGLSSVPKLVGLLDAIADVKDFTHGEPVAFNYPGLESENGAPH